MKCTRNPPHGRPYAENFACVSYVCNNTRYTYTTDMNIVNTVIFTVARKFNFIPFERRRRRRR